MKTLLQIGLSCFLVTLGGCSSNPAAETGQEVLQHDFTGTAVPWRPNGFDAEEGKFTFTVFSDLTGGERDGVFDVAIEQLRLLRPELIANLRLSGIFNKTGNLPLNGEQLCFADCAKN